MRGVVEHINDRHSVRLSEGGFGMFMETSPNGYQWDVFEVDEKLLMMMQCAIAQFLNNKDKK